MGRSSYVCAVAASIVVVTIAGGARMYAQNMNCGIEPHAETQRELAEAFAMADINDRQYWRKMTELRRLARSDGPQFVRQAILYEANQPGSGPASYLALELQVSEEDVAEGIAPLLYCDSRPIREIAQRILRLLVRLERGNGGEVDLSHWRHFAKPEIVKPLRRAIFETQPVGAFFFFSGEWTRPGTPEIARSDIIPYRRRLRVIDNALYEKSWLGGITGGHVDQITVGALRELATSKYWWSRLFVAEIMAQNKEFRDPEIVRQLKDDENELVRNSIAALENPDPLRATPVDR